ncbi:transcription factor IIIA-like [Anopheles marshallii]|uniref:transcription factor IIIA-like n=1 Tax=Anopheles marshallii TaxID=1521116 RepID=UPI00237B4C72|nr:transcription factor IIIA-like [Anopheles marshallii]
MAPYVSENDHRATIQQSEQAMVGSDILSQQPLSALLGSGTSNRSHRYKCEFCQQTFKRRDDHDRHRFSHTGVYAYPCLEPKCGKAYSNRSHLLRHTRTNHLERPGTSRPELHCKHPNCTMKYTSKHAMKRHYQTKHVLGKPYACDVCNERFWRKLQLKLHKVRHTGQYPHRCEHCNQGFVNLKSMRSHRCKRNAQKCADCPKEFLHWSELVAHRRLEHPSEFRCDKCDKLFHTKRNLNLHGRVHRAQDERVVFECPHEGCPRFYEHERNLYAHVRAKHENRKRVELMCPVAECSRVLATRQKLEHHRKMHLRASKTSARGKNTKKAVALECCWKDLSDSNQACSSKSEETSVTNDKSITGESSDSKSLLDVTTDSEVENNQTVEDMLETHMKRLCTQLDMLQTNLVPV